MILYPNKYVHVNTGCIGGVGRGRVLKNGIGSGGGHGGKGGLGCYNGSCVDGGISYGNSELPCELGSGSGDESSNGSTAGGGTIGNIDQQSSSLLLGLFFYLLF